MAAGNIRSRRWHRIAGAIGFGFFLVCASTISAQFAQREAAHESIVPIGSDLCQDMRLRHVLRPNGPITCDRLKLVTFDYIGFDGKMHEGGELVVMDATAPAVLNIFRSLRQIGFPIHKAKLMNEYDGNDDASMADNNTSAFNDRQVVGGTSISLHAYGLAIDLNPVQNPFLRRSKDVWTVAPPAGAEYVNRLNDRPWQEPRPGLAESVIDIFADNGFLIWGGYWGNPIDYQHFQVARKTAERLARTTRAEAEDMFNRMIERYRVCMRGQPEKGTASRTNCIMLVEPTAQLSRRSEPLPALAPSTPKLQ